MHRADVYERRYDESTEETSANSCPECDGGFALDEAHYLFSDATSLEFLETAVRHSRHYDLSIQFITQTSGEFSLTPETRTIANLCSLVMLHRVDESAEQLAEWFGLSDHEANWVQTAKTGADGAGCSEALFGIDEEGWFPLRIRASPAEASVIDGEKLFKTGER